MGSRQASASRPRVRPRAGGEEDAFRRLCQQSVLRKEPRQGVATQPMGASRRAQTRAVGELIW
jgi:hypothetical protein